MGFFFRKKNLNPVWFTEFVQANLRLRIGHINHSSEDKEIWLCIERRNRSWNKIALIRYAETPHVRRLLSEADRYVTRLVRGE